MDTALYDYHLPSALIAQEPAAPRDAARLFVVGADHPHRTVADLPEFLRPGDLLVLNRTRVIPARLAGRKASGGAVEVLLVHPLEDQGGRPCWSALIRGKVRPGTAIELLDAAHQPAAVLTVLACDDAEGTRTIAFAAGSDVLAIAEAIGHTPLPPYIARADRQDDRERYQTVFGDIPGSVAAPTASLHLTPALLARLGAQGVRTTRVELRIGPGTFKPVDTERVEDFRIHAEWCCCPPEAVADIQAAKAAGGRVIAVGTTAVRTVETAAQGGTLAPWAGWTRLYCHPPWTPQVVDGLLTNFHLPRSSLLMLVSCFTGLDGLRATYAEAVARRYRFFSYGDAMLVV
jgi:S-adenosylmethionine:tRNA ribosyltransferase-isomerase